MAIQASTETPNERNIQVLPEVQAWVNAREEADQTHVRLRDAKRTATRKELDALDRNADDYHTRRYEVDERLYRALDALSKTRGEAYDAADEKLKADASLPIITWLLDNAYEEFPDHVSITLKALPLTRAELVTLSQEQGWCNVFDDFLRQMDAAELFGPRDPQELAQEKLDQFLSDNLYHRDANRARELVGKVVDAAITKKAAEGMAPVPLGTVDDIGEAVWVEVKANAPIDIDRDGWPELVKDAVRKVLDKS